MKTFRLSYRSLIVECPAVDEKHLGLDGLKCLALIGLATNPKRWAEELFPAHSLRVNRHQWLVDLARLDALFLVPADAF